MNLVRDMAGERRGGAGLLKSRTARRPSYTAGGEFDLLVIAELGPLIAYSLRLHVAWSTARARDVGRVASEGRESRRRGPVGGSTLVAGMIVFMGIDTAAVPGQDA